MSVWTIPAILTGLATALTGWAAFWSRRWRQHARRWHPAPGDLDRLVCDIREHIAMEWLRDELDPSPQWQQLARAMDRRPAPTRRELTR